MAAVDRRYARCIFVSGGLGYSPVIYNADLALPTATDRSLAEQYRVLTKLLRNNSKRTMKHHYNRILEVSRGPDSSSTCDGDSDCSVRLGREGFG
jgi:hypothetical protein